MAGEIDDIDNIDNPMKIDETDRNRWEQIKPMEPIHQ